MRTLLIPLLLTFPALSDTYIHNSMITNSVIGSNIISHSNDTGLLLTKDIELQKNFNSIKINLPAKVEIRYAPKKSFMITMEKIFINNISIKTHNNRLEVKTIGSINSRFKINIIINTPSLEILDVSSTAEVLLNDFHIEDFKLFTSGTSKVTFVSGKIKNLFLNSKGTSKIYLEKIDIKNATIVSKGTSKTWIKVSNNLDVDLSNIAKVMYKGKPTIQKSLVGLGKLMKIQ